MSNERYNRAIKNIQMLKMLNVGRAVASEKSMDEFKLNFQCPKMEEFLLNQISSQLQ